MQHGIFISYRREDAAGYAGRLYDRLAGHFGAERVFMDVEGIEPGADFVEAIERAVGSCEALIVIIGDEWLSAESAGRRRLDDPADFVRIETATALARGIRVVPVLVEGAVMPRADQLPADLAPLTRRQAVELSHKQWDASTGIVWKALSVPIENPYFVDWYSHGRVVGWDSVSVPAGNFKALRVELESSRQAKTSTAIPEPRRVRYVIWYAPDAKRTVKHVRTVWAPSGAKLDEDTYELVKYRVQ